MGGHGGIHGVISLSRSIVVVVVNLGFLLSLFQFQLHLLHLLLVLSFFFFAFSLLFRLTSLLFGSRRLGLRLALLSPVVRHSTTCRIKKSKEAFFFFSFFFLSLSSFFLSSCGVDSESTTP
jgi:hypothetical protein